MARGFQRNRHPSSASVASLRALSEQSDQQRHDAGALPRRGALARNSRRPNHRGVHGLKARGGFEVDLEWDHSQLGHAIVRSTRGGNCRLRTAAPVKVSGSMAHAAAGTNPNVFYHIVDAGKPQVADAKALVDRKVTATTTIDFGTVPGGIYEIVPVSR